MSILGKLCAGCCIRLMALSQGYTVEVRQFIRSRLSNTLPSMQATYIEKQVVDPRYSLVLPNIKYFTNAVTLSSRQFVFKGIGTVRCKTKNQNLRA